MAGMDANGATTLITHTKRDRPRGATPDMKMDRQAYWTVAEFI